MPHNIYLHSALVQSRGINSKDRREVSEANKYYAIESAIALFFSFIINMFLVAVFASGFHDRPHDSSDSANSIGLESAGDFLKQTYGNFSYYMWAIGLLAAGQSSTMTGTYAGQFVMEGFLQLKIPKWKRLMITRSVAIVPAVAVALAADNHLDGLDEWLNVLQSVQLPFALLPVLYFTSDIHTMGYFTNSFPVRVAISLLSTFVIGVNLYFVIDFVLTSLPKGPLTYVLVSFGGGLYTCFLVYLLVKVLLTFRNDIRINPEEKRKLLGLHTSVY